MVEPPGIAPGSGPLITSAFIAIVRANPDRPNIGLAPLASKRWSEVCSWAGDLRTSSEERLELAAGFESAKGSRADY